MYSVVLMMALSGGGDAVDFGHRKACHGGGACSGAVACHGAVVARGCTGAGHCHGRVARGCHGASGCTGSCHGGGLFSKHRAHRCHGSSGCTGSYGCTGAVGCHGGAGCHGGVIVAPGTPMTPEVPKVMPKKEKVSLAPATIVVSLPANATLTVDGTPTTQTAAQRTLVTPALEEGTFVYTLQAQFDGQTQTQEVQVRAGQTSQAQFSFPQGVVSR